MFPGQRTGLSRELSYKNNPPQPHNLARTTLLTIRSALCNTWYRVLLWLTRDILASHSCNSLENEPSKSTKYRLFTCMNGYDGSATSSINTRNFMDTLNALRTPYSVLRTKWWLLQSQTLNGITVKPESFANTSDFLKWHTCPATMVEMDWRCPNVWSAANHEKWCQKTKCQNSSFRALCL